MVCVSGGFTLSRSGVIVPPAPVMVAYGDSTTTGDGASDPSKAWPALVASTKGWRAVNAGWTTTTLQNTTQNTVQIVGGATVYNGRDNYNLRVTPYSPDYVLILYGLNDLRLNDAAFTSALFQNDLEEIASGLIASGVLASRIVIGSPPYMDPAEYGSYAPWDAGTTVKHEAYVAAAQAAAAAAGVLYADVYQAMLDGGDTDLVSADGIHPNDAGYAVIADTFLGVL